MSMDRCILHSDMNSFYASVEMMLDPRLKGKAVAVCGPTEDRHGIVLAKSDLAKKCGVKTGMVNWEAEKLCPDLIMVPPHYDQYLKYSKLAHEIYYRYTDLVEPYGMDECWLDITGSTRILGAPMKIAEEIRKATREELGLTVSIGVSFNKIFAKLGSDMKKPDAITEITRNNYKEKVWRLPAGDLLYVGASTNRKLSEMGIYTIGELAHTSSDLLVNWFGVNGGRLWTYANGEDTSKVMHRDFVSPMKSIGHGITCTANLNDNSEVWLIMLELCQDIGHRLRIHRLKARSVQVYIRTDDLKGYQFQTPLPFATQLPTDIAKSAYNLFCEKYNWNNQKAVRAVCVRAIDLLPVDIPEQLDLFADFEKVEKRERVQDAVEEIRFRFGKQAVTLGSLLQEKKLPYHYGQSDTVKMPGLMYQ